MGSRHNQAATTVATAPLQEEEEEEEEEELFVLLIRSWQNANLPAFDLDAAPLEGCRFRVVHVLVSAWLGKETTCQDIGQTYSDIQSSIVCI